MNLAGAVCVVTGGSAGIGRATAVEAARRGATVALVSRRADRLSDALEEVRRFSSASTMHVCDVGDAAAVHRAVDDVLAAHDRIDVLVANAGAGRFTPLVDMSDEEIDSLVRTNVLGQMFFTRAVLPHMMQRRSGHIVVLSSTNGRIPPPLMTVYNATKFAAIGFGETLLYEVEPYGIGVTVVYPGAIDTEFFDPPEFAGMRTPRKLPVQRVGRAIVRGIERGAYDVSVPRILRLPAVFRVLAPPLIRRGVRNYAKAVVPKP